MKRKKRLQLLGLLLFILFAQPIIGRASGAEVYSVQFINEGKVVQTKEIPESTVLGALPTAGRKTGYQFAGWWNKGAEATPNTLITENKTYQGKWQPFTYKVKYNTPYFADWQQTSKTDEIFTLKKLTKK
ncbi:MAG: InlB B-repeat-containing protein [Streptococcaceae bacterium]|jgi:hypothetical protein|nr:InlB B-repeat-containing protein [Streptococcaceae bacterium]